MSPFPKTSLIISVYKNTKDLSVVLASVEEQTVTDIEVIISEDGNSDEMKGFINDYSGSLSLVHLTQPDLGWQKNKALNQAIRNSKGDYLIFIDGDCVLHPKFIEEHLKLAEEKIILAGRRVKLGPKASAGLRKHKNAVSFSKYYSLQSLALFSDRGSFIDEGIYSPLLATKRKAKTLKGCNFSCYKSALIAINGFDEMYTKPAVGEDTDLDWRFEALGFSIKSVRHLAIQYHLYHKESWTSAEENIAYMKDKQNRKEFIAVKGLQQS